MSKLVVLTGITGFIAKRIALDLLEAGHSVRGSLRSMKRADEVRDALREKLSDINALERLTFVELDLAKDEGWPEAMEGADVLMHTASPFPMAQPKNADDIIRTAVDGTLRALNAAKAAGVNRVVQTSSMVAIMFNAAAETRAVTESDWTDVDHPTVNPYAASKTLAEKAAWDFMETAPDMTLITVNPGLVVGEPMDANYGTSLNLIERLWDGKDPMLPNLMFPIVDLDDVSKLHVQAVEDTRMDNTRNMAAVDMVSMVEMGRTVAARYPSRKVATKAAPGFLLKILSLFDPAIKGILPQIGIPYALDNTETKLRTGIAFTPSDEAIFRSTEFLAKRA